MSSLPSGVRLVRLLNEHLNDIMNRERANQNSIHLFPDSEITPMRLLGYPFPVVMVSVTDRSLRSYARKHILRRDDKDYKQLTVPGFSLSDYQGWHKREVEGLPLLSETV